MYLLWYFLYYSVFLQNIDWIKFQGQLTNSESVSVFKLYELGKASHDNPSYLFVIIWMLSQVFDIIGILFSDKFHLQLQILNTNEVFSNVKF